HAVLHEKGGANVRREAPIVGPGRRRNGHQGHGNRRPPQGCAVLWRISRLRNDAADPEAQFALLVPGETNSADILGGKALQIKGKALPLGHGKSMDIPIYESTCPLWDPQHEKALVYEWNCQTKVIPLLTGGVNHYEEVADEIFLHWLAYWFAVKMQPPKRAENVKDPRTEGRCVARVDSWWVSSTGTHLYYVTEKVNPLKQDDTKGADAAALFGQLRECLQQLHYYAQIAHGDAIVRGMGWSGPWGSTRDPNHLRIFNFEHAAAYVHKPTPHALFGEPSRLPQGPEIDPPGGTSQYRHPHLLQIPSCTATTGHFIWSSNPVERMGFELGQPQIVRFGFHIDIHALSASWLESALGRDATWFLADPMCGWNLNAVALQTVKESSDDPPPFEYCSTELEAQSKCSMPAVVQNCNRQIRFSPDPPEELKGSSVSSHQKEQATCYRGYNMVQAQSLLSLRESIFAKSYPADLLEGFQYTAVQLSSHGDSSRSHLIIESADTRVPSAEESKLLTEFCDEQRKSRTSLLGVDNVKTLTEFNKAMLKEGDAPSKPMLAGFNFWTGRSSICVSDRTMPFPWADAPSAILAHVDKTIKYLGELAVPVVRETQQHDPHDQPDSPSDPRFWDVSAEFYDLNSGQNVNTNQKTYYKTVVDVMNGECERLGGCSSAAPSGGPKTEDLAKIIKLARNSESILFASIFANFMMRMSTYITAKKDPQLRDTSLPETIRSWVQHGVSKVADVVAKDLASGGKPHTGDEETEDPVSILADRILGSFFTVLVDPDRGAPGQSILHGGVDAVLKIDGNMLERLSSTTNAGTHLNGLKIERERPFHGYSAGQQDGLIEICPEPLAKVIGHIIGVWSSLMGVPSAAAVAEAERLEAEAEREKAEHAAEAARAAAEAERLKSEEREAEAKHAEAVRAAEAEREAEERAKLAAAEDALKVVEQERDAVLEKLSAEHTRAEEALRQLHDEKERAVEAQQKTEQAQTHAQAAAAEAAARLAAAQANAEKAVEEAEQTKRAAAEAEQGRVAAEDSEAAAKAELAAEKVRADQTKRESESALAAA
ncbi:unnamed protein product, partial [Amoebophrya sp. A25]